MYQPTINWSYLFYPPPYNFLAPPLTPVSPGSPEENSIQSMGLSGTGGCNGLGCAQCGGTCGMGQTDSAGLFGTGLFTTADFTQWGWGEWAVVVAGSYFAISAVNDLQTGYTGARKAYKKYSSKSAATARRRGYGRDATETKFERSVSALRFCGATLGVCLRSERGVCGVRTAARADQSQRRVQGRIRGTEGGRSALRHK